MPSGGYQIFLHRDQAMHWFPTYERWKSFGMEITQVTPWNEAREL